MPATGLFIVALMALNLVLIGLGMTFGQLNHGDPSYFMREGKALTHLSAIQLGSIAVLAFLIFQRRRPVSKSALLWLVIAAGFGFLVVDELAQFHENLDKWIHHWLNIKPTSLTTRLDDMIILSYGLLGLGALYAFRKELASYKNLWPLLLSGFVIMGCSVGFDLFTHRTDLIRMFIADPFVYLPVMHWLHPVEDGLKTLAEAIFLGMFYGALRQTPRVEEPAARPTVTAL